MMNGDGWDGRTDGRVPLTHARPALRFGHAGGAAVDTLVASLGVAALLVRRANAPGALVDVWKSTSVTSSGVMTAQRNRCNS